MEPGKMKKPGQEPLKPGSDRSKSGVMRRRVIAGLALGIAGICLGVTGAVFSSQQLTIVAACCAVAGCFLVAGTTLLPLLAQVEHVDGVPAERHSDGPLLAQQSAENSDTDGASVIDPVTEFPDGRYFQVAVEGRVAAARRHLWPVSVVLLQLGFDPDNDSQEARSKSLASFAGLMRQTLREADIACRIDSRTFGLILEDTSEEGGVWTAERIQIALSRDETTIRSLVAGVAAYPTHGLFSKDVLLRAQAALHRASSAPAGHGLGQVEVAHVDLS